MDGGFFFKKLFPSVFWSLLYHQANAVDFSCHSISANTTDSPSNPYFIRKGGSFTLQCRVPFAGVHMWFKDGKTINPNSLNKYHLEQEPPVYIDDLGYCMTMKLIVEEADSIHTGEYKCNFFGSHSLKVVVVTENLIVTNEDEAGLKLLTIGKDLDLQCNITECEGCGVVWFKNGILLEEDDDDDDHINIDDETNSITFHRASYNDSGIYMCAINRKQLDIALNASIEVQTEIKLEKFESASDVVVEGQPLELYCRATAAPTPLIKWFKGDVEIDDSHERIKLVEYNNLKNGKLLIEEADFDDRDHYSCEAYNRVHSSRITVFIRVKDKLAALWPFLGICIEVGILCTIIFVYEKRKSSQGNATDTDVPTDNRNVRDQPRGEGVRQRK